MAIHEFAVLMDICLISCTHSMSFTCKFITTVLQPLWYAALSLSNTEVYSLPFKYIPWLSTEFNAVKHTDTIYKPSYSHLNFPLLIKDEMPLIPILVLTLPNFTIYPGG